MTPHDPNGRDRRDAALETGAYALDALEAEELAAFEEALASDRPGADELRAEATGLRDTAVALGAAVPAEEPGAGLRARILAAAAATPQLAPEAELESDVEVLTPSAPERPRLVGLPGGAERAPRPARRSVRSAIGMLAAAAAVAIGIATTPLLTSTPAYAMSELASAADAQSATVSLEGGGSAVLVWSGERAASMLVVDGLAPLEAEQVYELWYIRDGAAHPAGLFSISAAGLTAAMLEGEMHAGDTIGVTVEPAGGSEAPTTTPVVVIASA